MAKQRIFDIKTSINPLIRGKFGPKNKIYPNAIKGALQGLRQFLITERPLKMMKMHFISP